MFRRIQKVGGKTYSLNLPIKWITKMGLKKKANLLITELDTGDLLISPPLTDLRENSNIKKCEIPTSKTLSRDITRSYLLGYEQLVIKSDRTTGFTQKELDEIEEARKRFPAAEIMSEEKNKITIEIIASFDKNNPYKLIHRIFNLTANMLERIYKLFQPHKINIKVLNEKINFDEELGRIKNIDEKINRTYFLIVRQLRALIQNARLRNKVKIKTLRLMDYRLISHLLENIGDNCVLICEHLIEFKNQILPILDKSYDPKKEKNIIFDRMISVSKEIKSIHQQTFNSFIRNDEVMATEIILETISFPTELKRFLGDLKQFHPNKSGVSIIMYRFYDIFDKLIDICDLIQHEDGLNNKKHEKMEL
ncbi:MAG: PhoU domain-containing protein [Promethearchaeota archaeon]